MILSNGIGWVQREEETCREEERERGIMID